MERVLRCLVVLVGLFAVVLVSCRKETEEFDFTAAPAEESRDSLPVPMAEVLPGEAAAGGLVRGAPRYYDGNSLYEYMDGGAERYLAAGFQGLITCVYTGVPGGTGGSGGGEDQEVAVEVYRLNSPSSARSLLTLERDGNLRDFPAGEQGALGRMTLLFYRGEFYVKLMAYSESQAMDETLKRLAAGIDRKILERQENEGP